MRTLTRPQAWMTLLLLSALAALICIADRAPLHDLHCGSNGLDVAFDTWLAGILDGSRGGPYIYRVLIPYALGALTRLAPQISAVTWDLLLKFVLLIALQVTFFAYVRRLLEQPSALTAVFLLDILVGFSLVSIRGPHVVETADIFATVGFVVSLALLRAERYGMLALVLCVSTLNRETPFLLLPAVVVHEWCDHRRLRGSVLALVAVALPYLSVRLLLPDSVWMDFSGWRENLPFLTTRFAREALVANVHVALLLGPLCVLGGYRFREHPRFLQHTAAIVPAFVVVHYGLGNLIETRLWMPLFPLLVPLAIDTWLRLSREA